MTEHTSRTTHLPFLLLHLLQIQIIQILLILLPLQLGLGHSLTPFQRFTFTPNNHVCVHPRSFHTTRLMKDGSTQKLEFTLRNVPGDGDCMFLAVALATSTSMGLGGNHALLCAIARDTRAVVAQILSTKEGHLHVEGRRIVRAGDLLKSAARQENLDPKEYLERLQNGTLQGGGTELTILSNVLRRPISIYELDANDWDVEMNEGGQIMAVGGDIPEQCNILCVGTFGDLFKDPIMDLPNPAVLSTLQKGAAYSWHLHVLVLDSGNGEKHACALLPQDCYI